MQNPLRCQARSAKGHEVKLTNCYPQDKIYFQSNSAWES